MIQFNKTYIICVILSLSWVWGDCEEGEVELWDECYSIENTTEILLPSSGLTGEIPETIGSLINLNSMVLYNNQLVGTVPESITNLNNLTWLNLYNNQLTGELPQDIGNLTNLTTLDLGFNQFIGEIPESLSDLTNLNHLWLFNNQLNGEIPASICNLYQNLEHFFIYNNQLCPPYPACLTEEDIGYQDTTDCSLCEEGEVMLWNECYSIEYTTELDLSYDEITGEIPPEIGNLTNLISLNLKENQFTGEIPDEIGNLTNLTDLDLGGNLLTGEIPSEITYLTNLAILDLGGNQLSGEIPLETSNLTNLTELELGGNLLTGEIPSEIDNLVNLTFLHLEYNQLTGSIPAEIGNLSNLIWLNFVHNQLTGEIPSSICELDMNWSNPDNFNINYNQLCPPYPLCVEEYVGEQDTTNCSEPYSGPVWYVSTTGSGSNDGSEESPFSTIQAGIDASSDGDTVLVSTGTYVENINFNGKNIVVQGEDRETTIIDGNQSGSVVTFDSIVGSTVVLSDFTITGGNAYDGGGIYCTSSAPTIRDNLITGNVSETYGGGISCNYSSAVIIDNMITFNSAYYGGGISFDRYTSSVINRNNINGNYAVQGGGISCTVFSSPSIINNTISGNSALTNGGGVYCYYVSSPTVTNTIIWDNIASTDSNISIYSADPIFNYCDIQGNWEGIGNIDSDPLFVSPDSGNLHIQANSPCIDAGDPDSSYDPDGTIADMGAYYYHQESPGEPPDTLWTRTFGWGSSDYGRSVQQTFDGGYIIIGHTSSFGHGDSDAWLIKTDSNGNEEWNQNFGGSYSEHGNSVQQTNDGGYIITGNTSSFGNGDYDVWLIKTNSEGIEEWNQTFGGGGDDYGYSVKQTEDGGYIITGHTNSFGNGVTDIWLIKTDSDGNEEWNQTFDFSNYDIGYSVQQTFDDGYIVTGFTNTNSGGEDILLIKTNTQGIEEWNQTFDFSNYDEGYSVQQTTDGGYIITGYTESYENENNDVWLIKTNSEGIEEWNQTFGGGGDDYGYSVKQTEDDGYIITGYTNSFGNGDYDVWLIKTNSEGIEEWNQTFGGGGADGGESVQQTTDGGYIVTGWTQSYGSGGFDVWLIRLERDGEEPPPLGINVDYQTGWNLVGLPLDVEDAAYYIIFPESIEGTLYSFNDGYNLETNLMNGEGYWLRFNESGSTTISGTPIHELTISLSEGWNLVTGLSEEISVYSALDPDNIIIPNTLFGFGDAYFVTETLVPGKGYWLRAFQDGEITLTTGALAKTASQDFSLKGKVNTLSINGSELYFGVELADIERLSYSLPPKPPTGAFDVRFKDGWRAVKDYGVVEIMPTTETLNITYNIMLNAGEHHNWVLTATNGEEYILEGKGEITIPSAERFVLNRKPVIPISFSLHQNYPNPFNPITTLRYDLPSDALVTLSIYDMLGKEITQLVNTSKQAGFKSVQWDAKDSMGRPVSAGVYLYQIQAGEFVQTKKMVLLK